jgi:hypothetical protein
MQNVNPRHESSPRPEASRDPEAAKHGPGKQFGLLFCALMIVMGVACVIYFFA